MSGDVYIVVMADVSHQGQLDTDQHKAVAARVAREGVDRRSRLSGYRPEEMLTAQEKKDLDDQWKSFVDEKLTESKISRRYFTEGTWSNYLNPKQYLK